MPLKADIYLCDRDTRENKLQQKNQFNREKSSICCGTYGTYAVKNGTTGSVAEYVDDCEAQINLCNTEKKPF